MSDQSELSDVRAILRELRIRYDQLEKRAADAEARHLECSKQLKVEMEHHAQTRANLGRSLDRLTAARELVRHAAHEWDHHNGDKAAKVKGPNCIPNGRGICWLFTDMNKGNPYREKNGGPDGAGEPTTNQALTDVPF